MHAEIDLMVKLGEKARGTTFYVYRFNNTESLTAREVKNAKPCLMCQHVLKNAGISKVVYVNNDGNIEFMKNREMVGLVGDPSRITNRFLEREGNDHHGKFAIMKYVRTS